jgi:diguanylate cyclase (GGDEF)-like protein
MDPRRKAKIDSERPKTTESGIRLSSKECPRLYDEEDTEVSRTTAIIPSSTRNVLRPRLTMMSGTSSGRVISLDEKEQFFLGRARGADIHIDDSGVSRLHCRFVRQNGRIVVEDLRSTNGIVVNGNRVSSARLKPGDRVQLGTSILLQYTELDSAEDELARRLYEASILDPLTGAFSRKYFMERLDVEISHARRHKKALSLVLFDVDWFKRVNDTHGHAAGDAMLRAMVNVLCQTVRAEDVLTRYGGEEFSLLVRDTTLMGARQFAERIRLHVQALDVSFEGKILRVTVSVGVAELSECEPLAPADAFLRLADERLYRAKATGRNRVCTA